MSGLGKSVWTKLYGQIDSIWRSQGKHRHQIEVMLCWELNNRINKSLDDYLQWQLKRRLEEGYW